MEITVKVTQEDIDLGIQGSTCYCPIARALKRMGHKDVDVDGQSAAVDKIWYGLPDEAINFIDHFDGGPDAFPGDYEKAVTPFEFELIEVEEDDDDF